MDRKPLRDFGELMTVPEVARALRCTEGTVRHWIRTGRLPAIRVRGGRQYRIRVVDVLAFAEGLAIPVAPLTPDSVVSLEDQPLTAQLRLKDDQN